MKPAPFVYHRPTSLDEAMGLLVEMPGSRVLAGGQSLVAMLNLRLANPEHLIDLGRVEELTYIREEEGAIVIGAMTRQREIEKSALIAEKMPLLSQAISHVGHQQTRNWGTIGGSLCHLDPSAELPAVATTYDAQLTVQSRRGTRVIEMRNFPLGMMAPNLDADEMLTSIRFPSWPSWHGAGFAEFSRRHGDFAIAAAAVLVTLDQSSRIDRVSLTLAGVAPVALRLANAELALIGSAAGPAMKAILEKAVLETEVMGDPFVPAWYRKQIASAMLLQAMDAALLQAKAH